MRLISRALFAYALAATIAVSSAVGIAAEKPQSVAPSSSSAPSISIDNFGQVNDNYYRGAQPDGRDYADLAALGVKTVIDLQQDGSPAEGQLVEGAGMKFHGFR